MISMYTTLKRSLLVLAALVIAFIPTRVGSHGVAIGLPFTWYTSQEIVTFGKQPQSFSALLLLSDVGTALLVLAVVLRFYRARHI
jgi:hypothetical protein